MGTRERKKREREERRELILNTAAEIMKEEGIESISIRKIATRIEYSPAIIYHYFQDKADIINHLMQRGYQKIVNGLSSALSPGDDPGQTLEKLTRRYIEVALQMSDEYKTVQLNSSPGVLEFTSSLFKGASARKPALKILFQCLKDLYQDKAIDDDELELTAQIISTATFGLIIKLILEKDFISQEQRTKLIDHHIKCIIDEMVRQKPL